MVYAAIFAFGWDETGPLGVSWVTLTFLIFFAAAICQAVLAQRSRSWPTLLNWFIGIWFAYWLWGLAVTSFGYERPVLTVLLTDNTHPAMWGFPLVLGLIWWLKPSGLAVRRGLDIALLVVFAIVALRVIFDSTFPASQNIFGWTIGFGWWGLPFEAPLSVEGHPAHSPEWWLHWNQSRYGVSVRPSLVFEHGNTLGFFAAFTFVYGVLRRGWSGGVIAFISGALLIASTSQTSVVAAFFGLISLLILWVFFSARGRKFRPLVFSGVVIGVVALVWVVFQRAPSLTGRVPQWQSVFGNLNLDTFLGIGGEELVVRVVSEQPTVGADLHNTYVSALAWSGVIGALCLVALWIIGLWLGLRAAALRNYVTLALMATLFASSLTESTFAYRYWSMGNALLLFAVLLAQPAARQKAKLQAS